MVKNRVVRIILEQIEAIEKKTKNPLRICEFLQLLTHKAY